ncbi:acyltransferase family protein [Kitasatospora gansuensis]
MQGISAEPDPAARGGRRGSRRAGRSARAGRAGGRLVVLDGLRILAALMVVFHHYVGYGGSADGAGNAWSRPIAQVFPLASKLGAYMWTGVSLFFLISGFVIGMSTWGRGLGDFFTSRIVRLYPAYWFGVLATTAVLAAWPLVAQPLDSYQVLVNLTMFQSALHVTNVDASYWTLWYELCFYLLFGLVVRQGLNYRRVVAFCMVWTVMGMVSVGVDWAPLTVVAMPWVSSFFVAGLAYYLMYRFRPTLLLWGIVGVSLVLSLNYAGSHQQLIDPALGGRHLAGLARRRDDRAVLPGDGRRVAGLAVPDRLALADGRRFADLPAVPAARGDRLDGDQAAPRPGAEVDPGRAGHAGHAGGRLPGAPDRRTPALPAAEARHRHRPGRAQGERSRAAGRAGGVRAAQAEAAGSRPVVRV